MAIETISFTLAAEWIAKLAKAFVAIRNEHSQEIARIGDVFGDPEALAQLYVQPFAQNVNPVDYHEEHPGTVVRQPLVEHLFDFFSGPRSINEQQNKAVVLADSGMGKTSLLVMLKLAQLNSFFPPGYECELLKIGPDVLKEIGNIKDRNNKILLLDSLDEDPLVGRMPIEERIQEIFGAAKHFRRVVMTCRTQFFPKGEDDPYKWQGFIQVGTFRFMCLFMSPFTEAQVDQYLAKKFPGGWLRWLTRNGNLEKARNLMVLMKDLRFRPMLLSYIDLILGSDEESWNEYSVYEAMRDSWLKRETDKDTAKLTYDQLKAVSTQLALFMHVNDRVTVSREDIAKKNAFAWGLDRSVADDLAAVEIGGRSLLTKDSEEHFRFAHRSVMEFIVAEDLFRDPRHIEVTDQIRSFVSARLDDALAKDVHDLKSRCALLSAAGIRQDSLEGELAEGVRFAFVLIPAGSFLMGSPKGEEGRSRGERPQHEVRIAEPFYIAKYTVTRAQHEVVAGINPSESKGTSLPVTDVSWEDAQRFCDSLGALLKQTVRLPSEAQWEYACRAGTTTRYHSGDSDAELDRVGWYGENSGGQLHPVGEKEPNAFGLYDMHGNVWEWCEDDWHEDYDGAPSDGSAWVDKPRAKQRVLRGGSWGGGPLDCRSAYRLRDLPDYGFADWGFRVLLDLK